MKEEDIQKLEKPLNYKKRPSVMDGYINIVYKMLRDGIEPECIYNYVQQKGYRGNLSSLSKYIYLIEKNNFPERRPANLYYRLNKMQYPDGVTRIKRAEVLKCLLTCSPGAAPDPPVSGSMGQILLKYPAAARETFREFHGAVLGKEPQAPDVFLEKYKDSAIRPFCGGIKKDIAPVRNAISFDASCKLRIC